VVLDCFALKPDFLPKELALSVIYVRPNELDNYVDDLGQWRHLGRTFHPNALQARDVEQQGYCIRRLTKRAAALGHVLYAAKTV